MRHPTMKKIFVARDYLVNSNIQYLENQSEITHARCQMPLYANENPYYFLVDDVCGLRTIYVFSHQNVHKFAVKKY